MIVKRGSPPRSKRDFALVVMIPGDRQLSLKKVAEALGEKNIAMATERDVQRVTGFQIGAVSAISSSILMKWRRLSPQGHRRFCGPGGSGAGASLHQLWPPRRRVGPGAPGSAAGYRGRSGGRFCCECLMMNEVASGVKSRDFVRIPGDAGYGGPGTDEGEGNPASSHLAREELVEIIGKLEEVQIQDVREEKGLVRGRT